MNTITPRSRSPLRFFLLVFALSIPFWLLGTIVGYQILPGVPVGAFMFVCPVTAAVILVYRENKTEGVIALLKRSFDTSRIRAKIWYAPIILLPPVAWLCFPVFEAVAFAGREEEVGFKAVLASVEIVVAAAKSKQLGMIATLAARQLA